MAKDARMVADKWARRLSSAVDDIRAGVEATDKNPMQLAVQKKDKMRQKILEAIDSGRWENNLLSISVEEWKAKVINKGIPRIPQGVNESKPIMEDFFSQLLPYQENIKREIEAMPDVTLEDSINRAVTWIRRMAEFTFKRTRR